MSKSNSELMSKEEAEDILEKWFLKRAREEQKYGYLTMEQIKFKEAIETILDLNNKEKESDTKHLSEIGQLRTQLYAEKEKNKELDKENTRQLKYHDKITKIQEQNKEIVDKNYIHKDKIREVANKYLKDSKLTVRRLLSYISRKPKIRKGDVEITEGKQ